MINLIFQTLDALQTTNTILTDSLEIAIDTVKLCIEKPLTNDKVLGLSPDNAKILIPVLVTFSIFFLGIIINIIIKKYERKSYLVSIKSVITTWCKLLENPIKQQSKSCKDFNTKLQKSNEMQPEGFEFNNLLAGSILSLQLKDQIDAVILNHKGKDEEKAKCLFNIISQIEFINKTEFELRSKYEIYHHESLKYMDEWNEAFKKLDSIRTLLRIKYLGQPTHPIFAFYIEAAHVFNSFVKNNIKGGNFVIIKDQLLNPILDLCQKFILSNPDEPDIYQVSFIIQELFIIIKKWDANRTGTGQLFEGFGTKLDLSYSALNINIDKLIHRKFKFVLGIT
jgi:hypothetical protein